MTFDKHPRSFFTRSVLALCLASLAACAPGKSHQADQTNLDDNTPVVDIGLKDEDSAEGFDADTEESILKAEQEVATTFADAEPEMDEAEVVNMMADSYSHLDPNKVIRAALLQKAVAYFDKNKSKFANKNYITVVDFQKKSNAARFHVVNMKTGKVLSYYVAHGKGSDTNHDAYAERFSNVSGSKMSSLGPAKVDLKTYSGKYGRSIRLDGLASTNSNMRRRAVVIHGSNYVTNSPVKQGRSEGCFALPMKQKDGIIDLIQGGSLLYADQIK